MSAPINLYYWKETSCFSLRKQPKVKIACFLETQSEGNESVGKRKVRRERQEKIQSGA